MWGFFGKLGASKTATIQVYEVYRKTLTRGVFITQERTELVDTVECHPSMATDRARAYGSGCYAVPKIG